MSAKSSIEDSFYIDSKRAAGKHKPKEDMNVESYHGNDWGERLSYTVGLSYIAASSFGIFKGLIVGAPRKFSLPKKLIINNFFNAVGKESSRFGNAAADASNIF